MNKANNNKNVILNLLKNKVSMTSTQKLAALKLLDQLYASLVSDYTVGIVTALPHEMAAVESIFDSVHDLPLRGKKFKVAYFSKGSSNSERMIAVVRQAVNYGSNMAAVCASEMLSCFDHLESIILVGIAAGVPYPKNSEKHVRLGDIVVSNQQGVTQYDLGKQRRGKFEEQHHGRPPSAKLLASVNEIRTRESSGQYPWQKYLETLEGKLGWHRPSDDTDVLLSPENGKVIPHPNDPDRRHGLPKVFYGKIGSANVVLKSTKLRENIRDKHNVLAIEMEGSGVADATWSYTAGYLVIRGICDYADEQKNDTWQKYAALVAASYCRAVLDV